MSNGSAMQDLWMFQLKVLIPQHLRQLCLIKSASKHLTLIQVTTKYPSLQNLPLDFYSLIFDIRPFFF